MRRKKLFVTRAKRAVCSGLFLGVMCGLTGCVNPTVNPEITGTPASTPTGIVLPTSVPEPPTATPELTVTISPEPSAAPATTPEPSATPTMTPEPTEEPVTVTPEPLVTATPEPTVVPEQTATPKPEVTVMPVPMPTDSPDYVTLLQNGWQRTEDFFGQREIFFSGKFDRTELIASEGRYEYRYTASSDEDVWFYIIGEERVPVQLYLDELTQTETECRIAQEGGNDYSYSYEDGEIRIHGRVYACKTEGKEHRMRVEIRYRYEEEKTTEGYEFYLK